VIGHVGPTSVAVFLPTISIHHSDSQRHCFLRLRDLPGTVTQPEMDFFSGTNRAGGRPEKLPPLVSAVVLPAESSTKNCSTTRPHSAVLTGETRPGSGSVPRSTPEQRPVQCFQTLARQLMDLKDAQVLTARPDSTAAQPGANRVLHGAALGIRVGSLELCAALAATNRQAKQTDRSHGSRCAGRTATAKGQCDGHVVRLRFHSFAFGPGCVSCALRSSRHAPGACCRHWL
jgi:hypothetical protein